MRNVLASRLGKLGRRGRLFFFATVASLTYLCAIAVGCGLDDSAITQIGSGGDAGDATLGEAGPSLSDGGADRVCTPDTCNSFPSICRSGLDNGCGGTVDCTAACPNGQACIRDSGTCDGPPVCRDAGSPGGNCGTIVNPGNGLDASCGSCSNNFVCSSSVCTCASGAVCGAQCCIPGTTDCALAANTCCHLRTCTGDYPLQCGTALDNGCGGTLNCSGFCGSEVCDTTTSLCCTPTTCALANACNTTIPNGCHGSALTCGACATGTCASNTATCCSNTVCGGACCTAGQVCNGSICCTRDSTATTCGGGGGKCGVVNDNCGVATNCPGPVTDCADGNTCFGASGCKCGTDHCNAGQTCNIGGGAGTGHCTG